MLCRVLEMAQSGYYDWLEEPASNRAHEDARLRRVIRTSSGASHGTYGARRVLRDLREAEETCSKHRVARFSGSSCSTQWSRVDRLMRQANVRALRGQRRPGVPLRQSEEGPDHKTDLQESESASQGRSG
jgi:putative transposase